MLATYVSEIAKSLKQLKKRLGATTIRQGYKKTGHNAGTSVQVFVRFTDESCCDIWIQPDMVNFTTLYGGPQHFSSLSDIPISNALDSVDDVYGKIEDMIRAWLIPVKKRPRARYTPEEVAKERDPDHQREIGRECVKQIIKQEFKNDYKLLNLVDYLSLGDLDSCLRLDIDEDIVDEIMDTMHEYSVGAWKSKEHLKEWRRKMSQQGDFNKELRNLKRDTPANMIGYWTPSGREITEDPTWKKRNQKVYRSIVKFLTEEPFDDEVCYKGLSPCRICGKLNGAAEYTKEELSFPEGYVHYIRDHNVVPDKRLIDKFSKPAPVTLKERFLESDKYDWQLGLIIANSLLFAKMYSKHQGFENDDRDPVEVLENARRPIGMLSKEWMDRNIKGYYGSEHPQDIMTIRLQKVNGLTNLAKEIERCRPDVVDRVWWERNIAQLHDCANRIHKNKPIYEEIHRIVGNQKFCATRWKSAAQQICEAIDAGPVTAHSVAAQYLCMVQL